MDKSIELQQITKSKFKEMLTFLLGEEYYIATHDGGFNYILTKKYRDKDERVCLDCTWMELCMTLVPKRLGMKFLIIPVDDDEFNIAEYLLNYYNSKKEEFIDEICNPYDMDGLLC